METQTIKIMVVDDDATFRDRLVAAMSNRKLQAIGASGPPEARELARNAQLDRAVVDLRMPDGSGLELVTDLLSIRPDIKIVVLTGYGSIATALEAMRLGAVDYLTKPADADQILAAFDKAADRTHADQPQSAPSLARVEWEHIQRILTDCGGNISQTARVLRIHRRSLQRKLSKYPPTP
jgi:two-component system response regulator RegA